MPNYTGGSKHKKFKKGNRSKIDNNIEKYPGTEYGYITKKLGDCRFTVFCYDKKERLAHVRGKLRKKVWINVGDICLLGLRDFQDDKCDIMQKFSNDQVNKILQKKLIDKSFYNESQSQNPGFVSNDHIDFDEDDIFDRSGVSFDSTMIELNTDDYKWNINEIIDIQTGDGIERNVRIIGLSENEENMLVQFSDGEEEEWAIKFFIKQKKNKVNNNTISESSTEESDTDESDSEESNNEKSSSYKPAELSEFKYKKKEKFKTFIVDDNNEEIDIDDL